MKSQSLLLILILLFFGLSIKSLFLKEPAVWPDEAITADIAKNIVEKGQPSTELWQGLLKGVEKRASFYPPIFFYILAFWFKVNGLSIANQRLLTFVFSLGFLLIFYRFCQLILKSRSKISLLPLFLLTIDFTFVKASRISHPEIFVLFWGILALYFFTKSAKTKKRNFFFLSLVFLLVLPF